MATLYKAKGINSTYLVNAEGTLREPVEKKFFEGSLEGGSSTKRIAHI